MEDTLAALHTAIIAAPTDRTVRLVYADALDESGDPVHVARAAFIRAQIRLEAMADDDPQRATVAERCEELFADHWIDWWAPVCVGVGLPEPYVPRRRLRDRVKRSVGREKRSRGEPYTAHAKAWSIRSEEHGFTAQFIAGFPEMLYFDLTPNAGPELFARWAAIVPLARIRFGPIFNDESGEVVNGPYMAKVAELIFDRLSARAAAYSARSPHLKDLTSLKALPLDRAADVVRELVSNPTWTKLRSLTLTGVTPPDAIQTLAECCTLEELESLSLGIRDAPEVSAGGGLVGVIGAMFTDIFTLFGDPSLQARRIRWPDYWPALAAFARSPVIPRLRTLKILDAIQHGGALGFFLRRRGQSTDSGEIDPESIFPDTLVGALAAGLNPDKLVRLELPAARLAPAGRTELTQRFGPRLVLV